MQPEPAQFSKARVGTHQLEEGGMLLDFGQGARHIVILAVAENVDVEIILPGP